MLKSQLTNMISFMGVMSIDEKDYQIFANLLGERKGDECLEEPLEPNLIVGPPVGQCCKTTN